MIRSSKKNTEAPFGVTRALATEGSILLIIEDHKREPTRVRIGPILQLDIIEVRNRLFISHCPATALEASVDRYVSGQ